MIEQRLLDGLQEGVAAEIEALSEMYVQEGVKKAVVE